MGERGGKGRIGIKLHQGCGRKRGEGKKTWGKGVDGKKNY